MKYKILTLGQLREVAEIEHIVDFDNIKITPSILECILNIIDQNPPIKGYEFSCVAGVTICFVFKKI